MSNQLLKQLMDFEVGSGDECLSFVKRLARENRWSMNYAHKCFVEYKKFIYLVSESSNQITPSDQIDQVWHLHLSYTRSYWQDMCEHILGFPIHHEPTKGGEKESVRFWNQYVKTLELYKQTFGTDAPADIWPDVETRFSKKDSFQRVNIHRFWMLKKPSRLVGALVALPLFLSACVFDKTQYDLWFYIKAAIGLYVVYRILKWILSGGGKGGNGGGFGCGSGCGGGCGA